MNLLRLYREEGLAVRRRSAPNRATGMQTPMAVPDEPNARRGLDFVADALLRCRRIRILRIVEDFIRKALALVVDTSIGGRHTARELDALTTRRGRPGLIVSANATEMTSRAILEWASQTGFGLRQIDPGKPQKNVFVEASTAGSGTSAQTRRCSRPWPRLGRSLLGGGTTTTTSDRTPLTAARAGDGTAEPPGRSAARPD